MQASFVANPAISLLMALLMFFSAALGAGTAVNGSTEIPEVAVAAITAEGTFDFAMGPTADGTPALVLKAPEHSLYITAENVYLVDAEGTWTLPTAQLLSGSASLTEEDAMALFGLFSAVAAGISSDALTLAPMPNGFSLVLDVDRLCAELNQTIPQVLMEHEATVNPLLAKMTSGTLTCADILRAWPELGLNRVHTGFTLKLTVLEQRDGSITLLGSLCDANFIAKISEDGLDLSVTGPDGVSYQLNTDDFAVIAELLSQVTITEAALGTTITEGTDAHGHRTQTSTIRLDLTALARDLNASLAKIIGENRDTVDALLNRYRGWIALYNPTLAASLTADSLISDLNSGLISLPDEVGEVTMVLNTDMNTYAVTGHFFDMTLTGGGAESAGSYTLTIGDGDNPLLLSLDFVEEYSYSMVDMHYTLTCSEPVLGLFRSITFASKEEASDDAYDSQLEWALTTDTNVLRVTFSDAEQLMEAKVGPLNASFGVDEENEAIHFDFDVPGFFLSGHTFANGFVLDTPWLGLDYAESRTGFTLNGYFATDDGYLARTTFGADFHERSVLYAYLNGYGMDYTLTFSPNSMVFTFTDGRDVYTFMPDYIREMFVVTHNGEPVCTVATETQADGVQAIFVYDGLDSGAAPVLTLLIDTAPEAIRLPAGGAAVDVKTFCEKFESFMDSLD